MTRGFQCNRFGTLRRFVIDVGPSVQHMEACRSPRAARA
jgi:hypothetical protein